MQALILHAANALYTNGRGYGASVRGSTRLGRALHNMKGNMDVGKGYGGIYSYTPSGGRGSGYGNPYHGSSSMQDYPRPKLHKKPKKRKGVSNRRRGSAYTVPGAKKASRSHRSRRGNRALTHPSYPGSGRTGGDYKLRGGKYQKPGYRFKYMS